MSTREVNLPQFIEKAVGVPYTPFGRDMTGWDCWGLIYVAYKDLLNIVLPLYNEDYDHPENRAQVSDLLRAGKDSPEWHNVEKPLALDIILLKIAGVEWHVGLSVKKDWMLHSWRNGTHCTRLSSVQWNKRIEGFYRHESRSA